MSNIQNAVANEDSIPGNSACACGEVDHLTEAWEQMANGGVYSDLELLELELAHAEASLEALLDHVEEQRRKVKECRVNLALEISWVRDVANPDEIPF